MSNEDWKYKAYPEAQCKKLAARLKYEWLKYKDEEKTTQTEFARKLGVTQSAFNQFLSGTCPISNEMILIMCRELNVDPQKMVVGLPFFEPFFKNVVSPRVVTIRYRLKDSGKATKPKAGAKIMVHSDYKKEVDVYVVELDTRDYLPRYNAKEKLIIAAEVPSIGEEAYVVLENGKQCASIMYHDHFECTKAVECDGCPDLTGPDDERISHIHKVIGMSK